MPPMGLGHPISTKAQKAHSKLEIQNSTSFDINAMNTGALYRGTVNDNYHDNKPESPPPPVTISKVIVDIVRTVSFPF
jgi:hypothetical protein